MNFDILNDQVAVISSWKRTFDDAKTQNIREPFDWYGWVHWNLWCLFYLNANVSDWEMESKSN